MRKKVLDFGSRERDFGDGWSAIVSSVWGFVDFQAPREHDGEGWVGVDCEEDVLSLPVSLLEQ